MELSANLRSALAKELGKVGQRSGNVTPEVAALMAMREVSRRINSGEFWTLRSNQFWRSPCPSACQHEPRALNMRNITNYICLLAGCMAVTLSAGLAKTAIRIFRAATNQQAHLVITDVWISITQSGYFYSVFWIWAGILAFSGLKVIWSEKPEYTKDPWILLITTLAFATALMLLVLTLMATSMPGI